MKVMPCYRHKKDRSSYLIRNILSFLDTELLRKRRWGFACTSIIIWKCYIGWLLQNAWERLVWNSKRSYGDCSSKFFHNSHLKTCDTPKHLGSKYSNAKISFLSTIFWIRTCFPHNYICWNVTSHELVW